MRADQATADRREQYKPLYVFVTHYLHQDFDVNGENIDETLRAHYAGRNEVIDRLRDRTQRMIGSGHTDGELDDLRAERWGCAIEPEPEDGETWRDVLRRIIVTLDDMQR